jgi:hypothetical protein
MDAEKLAVKVVQAIKFDLVDRSGFDGVLSSMSRNDIEALTDELETLVQQVIEANQGTPAVE